VLLTDLILETLCESIACLSSNSTPDSQPEPSQPVHAPYRDKLIGRKGSFGAGTSTRRNSRSTDTVPRRSTLPPPPPLDPPTSMPFSGTRPRSDSFRQPYRYEKNQSRQEKRKPIVGANPAAGPVQGGRPVRQLFIYRVLKHVSLSDMRNFLKDQVTILDLQLISHQDAHYNSFKLDIPQSDLDVVSDRMFWPEGIGCRRYYPRRTVTEPDG
jgi:hypothetical protein